MARKKRVETPEAAVEAVSQEESMTVELPAHLGLNAAAPLVEQLLSLRGKAIVLDASKVESVGGQ
ncbi:hypothetical protein SAMN05428963_1211, partial [Consotaella salsifontis]